MYPDYIFGGFGFYLNSLFYFEINLKKVYPRDFMKDYSAANLSISGITKIPKKDCACLQNHKKRSKNTFLDEYNLNLRGMNSIFYFNSFF